MRPIQRGWVPVFNRHLIPFPGKDRPLCGSPVRLFGGVLNGLNVSLLAAIVLTFAFGGAAYAEDEGRLADVRALGDCEGCVFDGHDFSGQRLVGVNLSSAQLSSIMFDGAVMNIAIFDGAVLRDVSFAGANLKGASFVGAQLENVIFDDANLTGVVFEGALLDRTDLQSALLCNTQTPGDLMDRSDCE